MVKIGVLACLAGAAAINVGAAASARMDRPNLITENIPAASPFLTTQIGRYQNTRSAVLGGWAAGGDGVYVVTGQGETPQAFHVQAPGAPATQITFRGEPISALAPSPVDENLIAYVSDAGGDEDFQVYLLNRSDGVTLRISDGAGRKDSVLWAPDGGRLTWRATTNSSRRIIKIADIGNSIESRTVFAGEGAWSPLDWSPDGRSLLLRRYSSINESALYILEIGSGDLVQINPSEQIIAYGDAEFSHDGASVFYTSDEESEFLDVFRYNLRTKKKTNYSRHIDWDVEHVAVSPTGGGFAFVFNEAGRSRIALRSRFGRRMPAPNLPLARVINMQFKPDGKWLAFTLDAAAAPADVYSVRMSRRIRKVERWTTSAAGGRGARGFIEPKKFSYETFDQADGKVRKIPAMIYKPDGPGPHPVVIRIHGGPEFQSRPVFDAQIQYWVKELGVAVVAPNVRGSSGYGKSYLLLDNGFNRENAVRDIGALLDWIEDQPGLDSERVVAYGASYGGYMALASMIHFGERLSGAVDIVGISDFVTFLENTSAYRRDLRRAEYGDERDPDMRKFLRSISPLTHADKISKPLLVVQGLNDPRVPASESEQLLAAIRQNGGAPWYLLAKDEGHVFRKKSNRDALAEAVALFFESVLGVSATGESHADNVQAPDN